MQKLKGPQGQVASAAFPNVILTRFDVCCFSSVTKPYSEIGGGGDMGPTLYQTLILSIWLAYFVFGLM